MPIDNAAKLERCPTKMVSGIDPADEAAQESDRVGGSFFTLASTGQFTKEFTVGNGFIALAALIMGRWRPVLATIMCLFFGFVTQMASQLQTLSTPMPSQLLLVLPYIATIIAVAGLVGRVRPPAADGVPYEK